MTEYVLEILDGDRVGETIPLGEDKVTLGRKDSNTLRLADEKVSGQHAEIALEDGRYVLRDLGSRNGTLLDGRKVDEIVLSSFDTFQVGRVRLQFREKGVEGLAMHTIDEDRLAGGGKRRRGGVLGLVIGLVIAGGAGAWFSLQQGEEGGGRRSARQKIEIPRAAGNKLAEGVDSCETLEGWELDTAGSTFDYGGPARSGQSALQVVRVAAEDGGVVPDFALARSADPMRVRAGEALQLTAFVRAIDGGLGAVRLRFTSSVEEDAPAMWTGTEPIAADEFESVELQVAVPAGMDRVAVELLALLPVDDAEVLFDDIALVTGGDATAIDETVGACNVFGTGVAIGVRAGAETVLDRITPATPVGGLRAAGLECLSDRGRSLSAQPIDGGFRLESDGALRLVFAGRAAGGLRTRGADGIFRLQSGAFSAEADAILLGQGAGRMMIRLEQPVPVASDRDARGVAITVQAPAFDLVVEFDQQRGSAQAALRRAKDAVRDGDPGGALDVLGELIDRTPHDATLLGEASRLRAELRGQLAQRLEELGAEYRKASFFGTRGPFERIGDELDRLVEAYGERHVADRSQVDALRGSIRADIARLDAKRSAEARRELEALATVFGDSGDSELQELVRTYVDKHHGNGN